MKREVKTSVTPPGPILPDELLGKLNLVQGAWPYVTKDADGTGRL